MTTCTAARRRDKLFGRHLRKLPLHLLACLLWAFPFLALAQGMSGAVTISTGNEHRVALVIGNSDYPGAPLKNPINDARAVRDKLKKLGFDVILYENLKTKQVGSALREFRNKIRPGSIALFFYAGHGLQVRGENYLPTVDAELHSEEDVPHQSLNLNTVLNTMEDSKAGVNLILLDACRNNPFARSFRSGATGLARIQAPSGTLIHYATRPGNVAEDGSGDHGTYTEALLAQIGEEGVPIETALKRVTIRVRNVTKGKQEPWMEGSLTGDFYFIINGSTQITIQPTPANADAAAWQAAESANTPAAYQAYLAEYPNGLYAAAARIKLASLEPPAEARGGGQAVAQAGDDPETLLWKEARQKGSRSHYETYLQEYPKGRYGALARSELKSIAQREAEQKAQAEQQVWEGARQANSEEALQSYLDEYPKGRYGALARAALKKVRQDAVDAAKASAREQQRLAEERRKLLEAKPMAKAEREALRTAAVREMGMTRLTGAEFMMGASLDELDDNGQPDESARPQRNVRIANFEMSYYEVGVGQFRKFVDATGYLTEAERGSQAGCHVPQKGGAWTLQAGTSWRAPGYPQTDSHPVVCISWNDAQAYLQWLNGDKEGFRLPSEAEWEFAARGGVATPRPWSDTGGFWSRVWEGAKTGPDAQQPPSRSCKYANVADESLRQSLDWPKAHNCKDGHPFTAPSAYFGRNNFSLYDMLGNVAEWTQDCWHASHAGAPVDGKARSGGDCSRRVVRGGSWASSPAQIRSAARLGLPASYRAVDLGLRLVRTGSQ